MGWDDGPELPRETTPAPADDRGGPGRRTRRLILAFVVADVIIIGAVLLMVVSMR